jgi:glutamine amidotransferase
VTIAILDYGMGNLRSVEKAFGRVGAKVEVTGNAERAAAADGLVLPGVGAFPKAMQRIGELGLDRVIAERLDAGTPVLGICLGFQLLFESSSELGGARGLGLLEGEVTALEAPGHKLPHIGWEPMRIERESELSQGIDDETPFYFVHSYVSRPSDANVVAGSAEHGERFVCAIARPPLFGIQFHPEKSSAAGLQMLRNFASLCAGTSRLNGGGSRLRPAGSASQPA